MKLHRIEVTAGTPERGLTARYLYQDPEIKQTKVLCPLCDTWIDVPNTLEPEIRALAARLGGDTSFIAINYFHPPELPQTKLFKSISSNSKEAEELRKKTLHDL
jgi:hypothetical protein